MSDEEFKDYVVALEVKKLEKAKRLRAETSEYWVEIMMKQYHFRRSEMEVVEVRKVTKEDVIVFYDKFISPLSTERKKIATVILGKETQSLLEDETHKKSWNPVDNVLQFKSSLSLYPFVHPFNDVPLFASTKSKL